MTRRCSHCSHNGHNSRTCPSRGGGPKLFGVRLTDGPMKKSASMGNLSSASALALTSSSSPSSPPNLGSPSFDPLRDQNPPAALSQGYLSDDPGHASCSLNCRSERKKGTPWTEEEHRRFLTGLQKLGKGDWRGIARTFVVSRTPTQVASHAQKYFIRKTNAGRRKRRSSLFDMVPNASIDSKQGHEENLGLHSLAAEADEMSPLPSLSLSLEHANEPKESTSNKALAEPEENMTCDQLPPTVPAFIPAYVPVHYLLWPPGLPLPGEERRKTHQIVRPTPVHSKDSVNVVDELVSMSKLSLVETVSGRMEPSALSLELLSTSSRQSAFHANPPGGGSELSQSNGNAIHAV